MTLSHKWLNIARRLQGRANDSSGGAAIIEIRVLIGGDNEPMTDSNGEPVLWICTKSQIEPRRVRLDGLGDDVLEMVVRGM